MDPERDPEAAPPIRAVYDRIADHFAKTRVSAWPEVDSFLSSVEPGGVGLDVGCGNGRHTRPLADRVDRAVGLDVSRGLLDVAAADASDGRLDVHLVQAEASTLPIAGDGVDVGLYVATLHHLRSRAARGRSLDELARVLAPDGRAFVSAWSTEHDRFDTAGPPANGASEGSSDERGASDGGFDTTVDWTLPGGETVPRFYHIYDPGEFRVDLERSDLGVVDAFVSSGNCYARVKG